MYDFKILKFYTVIANDRESHGNSWVPFVVVMVCIKKKNPRDVHIKRLVGGLLLTLTCKQPPRTPKQPLGIRLKMFR